MPQIEANGILLEVERHGDRANEPLLLIRGLGSQIIHWPPAMIRGFVDAGFHVITFDNRDAGLSQAFPDGPEYTLEDMAADGLALLDALELDSVHALGISMGGCILQLMALAAPSRLRSATIVFSTSGAFGAVERSEANEALFNQSLPDVETHREDLVDHLLRCDHEWGSPAFPFDETERRALINRAIDRSYRPDGQARQLAAILSTPPFAERLGEVRTPTLVIHGDSDTLLPIEHGRDIAARIPGARMVEVEGMGHDLEGGGGEIAMRETVDFIGGLEA